MSKRRAATGLLQVGNLFSCKRTLVELVLQHGSHGGADNEKGSNGSGESVTLGVLEVQEGGSKSATDASVRGHVLTDPSGDLADGGISELDGGEVFHL